MLQNTKTVDLNSLAQWKLKQLERCTSVPAFYISVEGWRFSNQLNTALYSIEIGLQSGNNRVLQFRIEKRYSELLKLHKAVSKVRNVNESFPPKKIFGSKDAEFIRTRQKSLHKYFEEYTNINKLDTIPEFVYCFHFNEVKQKYEAQQSLKSR